MWIALVSGKRLYFPDCADFWVVGEWFKLKTRRGRYIASIRTETIAAYWYDTEKEASND